MTNNKTFITKSNRSWADVALDGLWPGLLGGTGMMIYLVLTGLLEGVQPLEVFGSFVPSAASPPLTGLVAHVAVSAVHGGIFGLITAVFGRWLSNRRRFVGASLLYALLLWLAARLVIIPSGLSGLGAIPTVHFLVAHLLFGAALGWQLANSRQP